MVEPFKRKVAICLAGGASNCGPPAINAKRGAMSGHQFNAIVYLRGADYYKARLDLIYVDSRTEDSKK